MTVALGHAPAVLTQDALDALMPMHLRLSRDGRVRAMGPTLARLCGGLTGQTLSAAADVRRPFARDILAATAPVPVSLVLRALPDCALTGIAVPLGDGILIDLSAGIGTLDLIRRHGMTAADLAPTNLGLDLAYLREANDAVQAELMRVTRKTRAARETAEEQAVTDTLTGLRNRRALDAVLKRLVRGNTPFALAHLDLDWFKAVNDTHGHAAGDHVLRSVARILLDETRAGDTVARIGGDEFVLVFPGLVDPEPLRGIGGRILARIEAPIAFEGAACRVSASIGIAVSGGADPDRAGDLLAEADRALYASKEAGRGRISFA
ncbi:GGDEF domain-containing protein [Anianabacter salinae]|uniref:GGDEF domain-containing protein n=1 Tax=Anianabacter salinae TaxID=2851023 RepID=UPI00225E4815|nr:GGDEF domain-containing protein [Anianabacter salinae]MBV0911634.1 GGDEF domain-containing protein [Anianabacter salinae]